MYPSPCSLRTISSSDCASSSLASSLSRTCSTSSSGDEYPAAALTRLTRSHSSGFNLRLFPNIPSSCYRCRGSRRENRPSRHIPRRLNSIFPQNRRRDIRKTGRRRKIAAVAQQHARNELWVDAMVCEPCVVVGHNLERRGASERGLPTASVTGAVSQQKVGGVIEIGTVIEIARAIDFLYHPLTGIRIPQFAQALLQIRDQRVHIH